MAGRRVVHRLVTAGDLVEARAGSASVTALVARCVLDVDGADPLPDDLHEAVAAAIVGADPDAVLAVELECPDCAHSAELVLDPVVFLWDRVDDWAWRMLGDVHALAGAYGWGEDAILALSDERRNAYLSLVADDRSRWAAS